MSKISQEWLKKARNKSWFYYRYIKEFSKKLDKINKNKIIK